MLAVLASVLFAGFVALGTWQVQRRAWKLDLIERVDQRAHAAPVGLPDRSTWPQVTRDSDEYRRIKTEGTYLHDKEALVQAVTELGPGFWVLTPLRLAQGGTLIVNRGYVPADRRDPASRTAHAPVGPTQVTGLLRISEPKGGFLKTNDPQNDRWYSRDIPAIAASRGLADAAPFFVDADSAAPVAGSAGAQRAWPAGGLTVIRFPNSHLVYALTWYALALMVLAAAWFVARVELRRARKEPTTLRAEGEREDDHFD